MIRLKCEDYVNHFGIRFEETKTRMKLTRDNYAEIDRHGFLKDKSRKYILEHWDYFEKMKKNLKFSETNLCLCPPALKYEKENDELVLSEEFCKLYQEECLTNYDLNMKFIKKLNQNSFQKIVNEISSTYCMVSIKDLDECKNRKGIYMLVLDEYKQIYIGQTSRNLKERILKHWRNKPPFDKVLFGASNTSVISIDSYGVLDTTRIFVMYIYDKPNLDRYEEELIKRIPKQFLVNRIGGGIHFDTDYDYLKAIKTINMRNM